MSEIRAEKINGYAVAKEAADMAYLPADNVSAEERTIYAISRLAADQPDCTVGLTTVPTDNDGSMTIASFVWMGHTRVDMLYNFTLNMQKDRQKQEEKQEDKDKEDNNIGETFWTSAKSFVEFLNTIYSEKPSQSITLEKKEQPSWENNFVLLASLPASSQGFLSDKSIIQRYSSAIADYHILQEYDLTDEEFELVESAALIQMGEAQVRLSSLITVGSLNPFASEEGVILQPTPNGTVLVGEKVIVGPLTQT